MLKDAARCALLLVWLLAASSPDPLLGQGRTSAISGVVRDESGGMIAGARVEVRNRETGTERTVVTDAQGAYHAPLLELGRYDVAARKEGFKTSRHAGVLLEVDREAVVGFTLEVGELSESIEVSGQAVTVEASSSAISSQVNSRTIQELPLNGRDYIQLATLQAGAPVVREQDRSSNTGYGVQMSIAGSRPFQNGFRLDSISMVNYTGATPGSVNGVNLGVDAIREFSVLSSAYSAQYGRAAGGIVNAVTRSGTNGYHGTLFYFHRNDNFDARNFFDPGPLPEFRRHQFGASLGGPINKNRTFFFANFEALREARGNTQVDTTLTGDARRGLLSSGRIAVDPVMAKAAALYPAPNGERFGDTGLFVFANDVTANEDFATTRIDHSFRDAGKLFFRYSFDDGARLNETAFAAGEQQSRTRWQSAVLEETHVFSPNVLNAARIGLLRTNTVNGESRSLTPAADDPALAFVPGAAGLGRINVRGLTDFPGGSGALDADRHAFTSYQAADDLTWTRGRHTFKFGGRLERTHFNTDSQNRTAGEFEFLSIEDFLANRPNRFLGQLPGSDTIRGHRQWIAAWYVQSSWKLAPSLSLDAGLRHEWATVPTEVNGKAANLPTIASTQTRVGDPLFRNPSPGFFSPRAGIAWDVWGDGSTVVRGGYGIFPDLILSHFLLLAGVRNPPFFVRGSANDLDAGDFPHGGFQALTTGGARDLRVERLETDPGQPYVQQWNFNIEQAVGSNSSLRLAYVGSHGLNLSAVTEDANLVQPVTLPGGRLFFPVDGKKINPAFSMIRNRTFNAQSFYHGLQAQFRRRMSGGLQMWASYSYSKSIDDSSNFFANTEAANFVAMPVNGRPAFNRGLSAHDVRHSFVLSGIWEMPSPRGGIMKTLFGGWQAAPIISYASGAPMTARLGYDAARTGTARSDARSGQRPDLAPGRPNPVTGDPAQWVDPSAFLRPTPGFLGNLGRNNLIGPDLANVDLSIVKRTRVPALGDSASLDFRVEFFNLFNRTNFNLPSKSRMEVFDDVAPREDFARITKARKSREIQFGLKLRF